MDHFSISSRSFRPLCPPHKGTLHKTVCMHTSMHRYSSVHVCVYGCVCMYACVDVWMCACMHIYIHINIHIYYVCKMMCGCFRHINSDIQKTSPNQQRCSWLLPGCLVIAVFPVNSIAILVCIPYCWTHPKIILLIIYIPWNLPVPVVCQILCWQYSKYKVGPPNSWICL
jgi:hypothetical protein